MSLQLPFLVNANSAKRKAFKKLVTQVKNLLTQVKESKGKP